MISPTRFARALVLVTSTSIGIGCRRAPEQRLSDIEKQGQQIFRYDTFGDEQFWTDTARLDMMVLHLKPLSALGMGVKVDLANLNLLKFILHNPLGAGGTKELLKQDAVVGLKATFDNTGRMTKVGVTCALCHSTVNNALLPGIGYRLDGYPNRSLEVGKILAKLAPFTPQQKAILRTWPKGTYDPRFNFDGKSTPLVLPPAYGLAAIKNETYTAEGPISYWNNYVAVTQMHGHGNFSDPRLGVNIVQTPDMVGPKLPALRAYQHSIPAPRGDVAASDRGAQRGKVVFDANCARCHVSGTLTDNNSGVLHAPSETGMSAAYAERTTQKMYRTTPLRGLTQHPPYFHDGTAKTLKDVVAHYDRVRNLRLSDSQKKDLVRYLSSL